MSVGESEVRLLTSVAGTRPEWWEWAACLGIGHAMFFAERGESTRGAKEVCGRCSVQEECLDYALRTRQRFGIWGGLSERQRTQIRRRRAS